MRVLITGCDGQLGRALSRTAPPGTDLNVLDVDDVDFSDTAMLRARLVVEAPELIINAAAYKSDDSNGFDEAVAREVNADAVAILVEAVAVTGGKLVHVSCDCVFDSAADRRYLPSDAPNPQWAYGHTKALGESQLRPEDLLVRTSLLYAAGGTNIVRSLLTLMRENCEVSAAADKLCAPTWATSLAQTIWALIDKKATGTFHYTDEGEVTSYDFALAVAEEALAFRLIGQMPTINSAQASDQQAAWSSTTHALLDCSTTRALLGGGPTDWRANLRLMLDEEKALG